MLETPALLVSALAVGDNVVALDSGRDLDVGDLLQIEDESMLVQDVISANNYHVVRDTRYQAAHDVGAVVYQLPSPNKQIQLNSSWLDPNGGGWRCVGGVWGMGASGENLPAPGKRDVTHGRRHE
jgi:hypothetical protein